MALYYASIILVIFNSEFNTRMVFSTLLFRDKRIITDVFKRLEEIELPEIRTFVYRLRTRLKMTRIRLLLSREKKKWIRIRNPAYVSYFIVNCHIGHNQRNIQYRMPLKKAPSPIITLLHLDFA